MLLQQSVHFVWFVLLICGIEVNLLHMYSQTSRIRRLVSVLNKRNVTLM